MVGNPGILLGLLVYISPTIWVYLHMTYLRAKLYIARNRYLCLRLFSLEIT